MHSLFNRGDRGGAIHSTDRDRDSGPFRMGEGRPLAKTALPGSEHRRPVSIRPSGSRPLAPSLAVMPPAPLSSVLTLPRLEKAVPRRFDPAGGCGPRTGLLAKILHEKGLLTENHYAQAWGVLPDAVNMALNDWVNVTLQETAFATDMVFYYTDDIGVQFPDLEQDAYLKSQLAEEGKGSSSIPDLGGFGMMGTDAPPFFVGHYVPYLNELRTDLGWHLLSLSMGCVAEMAGVWSFYQAEDIAEVRSESVKYKVHGSHLADDFTALEKLHSDVPIDALKKISIAEHKEFFGKDLRLRGRDLPGLSREQAREMITSARTLIDLWETLPLPPNHLTFFGDIIFRPIVFVRWSPEDCLTDLYDDWCEYHYGDFLWSHWQFLQAWDWQQPEQLSEAIETTGKILTLFRVAWKLLKSLHYDNRLMAGILENTIPIEEETQCRLRT